MSIQPQILLADLRLPARADSAPKQPQISALAILGGLIYLFNSSYFFFHSVFSYENLGVLLRLALLLGTGWWATGMLRSAAEIAPKGFTSLAIERRAAAAQALQITIENQEGQPMRYRLELHAGGTLVKHSQGNVLEPGARWSTPLTGTAAGECIEVLLFREGEREPYRQVHFQPD